ncbi:chitobiase [Bacteroides thetaiotaomicron]|uniref:BACON domain-containing protein n=1 Tax=Bacteroides thetaiotaomicron TaxID=818 RepID=UPI00130B465D|nr:BACON domain-containing carbohydrate-binding protein [Bacteroides thetaiotaomicron]KAB4488771.1 chitobiase [Bacteroides thetaiotaomicron]KAB4494888.1 chitobiase [Bacteroides thetaiotaomicron]KAB4499572.1 chitobiase [Bacteroides thetaiotaomicron]KAB4506642.1 chitobiase [Bacteroides thetaiotaomicron]KAB4510726.1 chitobiase [Bacteroides thetaiotaomicron]
MLIIGLTGILGTFVALSSCGPDYETEFNVLTLTIPSESQAAVVFPLSGGEHEIEVETNVALDNWTVSSNAEWCKLQKQEGKVTVSADQNEGYKQRIAEVTIAYGHQSYSISVKQFGLEPVIDIPGLTDDGMKAVDAKATSLSIQVNTNLNLDVITVPDTCNWVRFNEPKELKAKKGQKAVKAEDIVKKNLVFSLDQNTDTIVRYCTITLQSSQNYNCVGTFIIKQQPRGYIVDIDDAHKVFEVKAMGETITIPFKVNGPAGAEYEYVIDENAQTWIKPATAPLTRGALRDASESFIIEPNTAVVEQPREGTITFTSKDPVDPNSFTVTVKQAGFVPVPPVNVVNATATPGAGHITLQWEAPEDVDYSKVKITYYDKVTKENKEIEIDGFKTTSAIIDDTYQCAGEYSFTFKTYGPTGMETESPVIITGTSGEASELERVILTVDMLSANATQDGDGGGLPALIDGKGGTYYHSRWQDPVVSEAHYVQIKLNKPLQGLRFEYDARQTGINNGGDVTIATIYGSTNGEYFESMGTEEFNLPTSNGGHATAKNNVNGKQAYNYIRFTPTGRRNQATLDYTNANKAWWNMAEMYLYRVRHDEAWAKEQLGI